MPYQVPGSVIADPGILVERAGRGFWHADRGANTLHYDVCKATYVNSYLDVNQNPIFNLNNAD